MSVLKYEYNTPFFLKFSLCSMSLLYAIVKLYSFSEPFSSLINPLLFHTLQSEKTSPSSIITRSLSLMLTMSLLICEESIIISLMCFKNNNSSNFNDNNCSCILSIVSLSQKSIIAVEKPFSKNPSLEPSIISAELNIAVLFILSNSSTLFKQFSL